MKIGDVNLLKHDTMKNQRTPRGSGDQRALLVPSWSPLGALVEPAWGTVGADQFDMLKKQKSSATAEKGGPAVGGGALGETLSKQVYLGRV